MGNPTSNHIIIKFVFADEFGHIQSHETQFPQGTLLSDVLKLSPFDIKNMGISVYGKKVPLNYELRNADRIEICRSLSFNPMESRKRRAQVAKMGILKKEAQRRRKVVFDSN